MNKKEIEKEIKEEIEKLKKEVENKSLYYPKEGKFDNKKRWYPNALVIENNEYKIEKLKFID